MRLVQIIESTCSILERMGNDGKKTMKSYLWSLELAAYDQAHS